MQRAISEAWLYPDGSAHELKHIIDHPSRFCVYGTTDGSLWPQGDIELLCDYFAGCLLMPRPAVKRMFTGGLQDVDQLAEHFQVSTAAMRVRLGQLKLRSGISLQNDQDSSPSEGYGRTRSSRTGSRTMQDAPAAWVSRNASPNAIRREHSDDIALQSPLSPSPADTMVAAPIGVRP